MRLVRMPCRSSEPTIGRSGPAILRISCSRYPSGSSSLVVAMAPCSAHIDAIDAVDVGAHQIEQLGRQLVPGVAGENAARGDELGAIGSDDLDPSSSKTSSAPPTSVRRPRWESRNASPRPMMKSFRPGVDRIEAGNFLAAFGDQNFHEFLPGCGRDRSMPEVNQLPAGVRG